MKPPNLTHKSIGMKPSKLEVVMNKLIRSRLEFIQIHYECKPKAPMIDTWASGIIIKMCHQWNEGISHCGRVIT